MLFVTSLAVKVNPVAESTLATVSGIPLHDDAGAPDWAVHVIDNWCVEVLTAMLTVGVCPLNDAVKLSVVAVTGLVVVGTGEFHVVAAWMSAVMASWPAWILFSA